MLFFSLVLVACGGSNNKPEDTVKGFVEATFKGDVKKMLTFMDIPVDLEGEEAAMVETKLSAMGDEMKAQAKELGGYKNLTIDKVEYNDDKTRAMVRYTILMKKNNEKVSESIPVIKTDKGWKIDFF